VAGAGGGSGATVTFSSIATTIQQNCGQAACHGGGRPPNLQNTATLIANLTSTVVHECGDHPLVTPGDPTKSALLDLPTWKCMDFVMPLGCVDDPCLKAEDLAALTAWIQAGAPMQ
jgi:hypothetical protein